MRRVLLINRLGIGDVVLTTPLAQIIKEQLGCSVGMVVADKAVDVICKHPYIDEVFGYSKKTKLETLQRIREKRYNEAIIVDERFSSSLLAWRAGCRICNTGFEISWGARRFFKRKERALLAVEDYAAYAQCLVSQPTVFPVPKPCVGEIDECQRERMEKWLVEQGLNMQKLVLLVPRGIAENKNWPVQHFNTLTQALNQQGIKPVYLGAKGDREYINGLVGEYCNAAGVFSLREVAVLAQLAAVTVTPCTGAMHVAATAGTPLIALYGPTVPERWAPQHAKVLRANIPCVPCVRLLCEYEPQHACMNQITPEQVLATMAPFLTAAGK